MRATVRRWGHRHKATAARACRDVYQRGRQEAVRSAGRAVAAHLGLSWQTLQHELSDGDRDPVRKVAARVRALHDAGVSPTRVALYLAEVLDAFEAGVLTGAESLDELMQMKAAADADENVMAVRAALAGSAAARTAHAEFLAREIAAARTLLLAHHRIPGAS